MTEARDWHSLSADEALAAQGTPSHGLSPAEAAARLGLQGPNRLPQAKPDGVAVILWHQFKSPLIYLLLAAAAISLATGHGGDAAFIGGVLALNALIGTVQEYGASRSAQALRAMVAARARVRRDGEDLEVPAEQLVTGDLVLLESGDKVPADLRLLAGSGLSVDESLLTGESLPVAKDPERLAPAAAVPADRKNMAFAGSLVTRGRGLGLVCATGMGTELGAIAQSVLKGEGGKAPLLERMEGFSNRLAAWAGVVSLALTAVLLAQGHAFGEVLLIVVALMVSVVPEGLPVALTVALSISTRRMSRRRVIVRRLVAVESLGSCTFIASDKTGTLTLNEMSVARLALPGLGQVEVTGGGLAPVGDLVPPAGADPAEAAALAGRLALAACLCNEAFYGQRDGAWTGHGDAVDLALLVLAHKSGLSRAALLGTHEALAVIPFEPERRFAAALHQSPAGATAYVKGALEALLPLCSAQQTPGGQSPLDAAAALAAAEALAGQGYRVLALASGRVDGEPARFGPGDLRGLCFLGLAALIDPLRDDSKAAVLRCQAAGIRVAMVTGDHPLTARVIADQLGLAAGLLTGAQLSEAWGRGPAAFDQAVDATHVFARVAPEQKLQIVQSLQRQGHFVAVTGDGANDAPALKAAQVGVAMGKGGTDVAREVSDILISDDRFSSIVAGIEEGRIAYANVRKVVYLLLSEGLAEILLFVLAVAFGMPLPLLAVQLLWLNVATNGIQDVALAFEPAEGDEMSRPPRPPRQGVLDRLMVERSVLAGLWMGGIGFAAWQTCLGAGMDEAAARNLTLLLLVLFENVHVGNCRSETLSVFRHSPLRNPTLLLGTLGAQGLHLWAMHHPGMSELLRLQPVDLKTWLMLLGVALTLLPVMELHKWWRRKRPLAP